MVCEVCKDFLLKRILFSFFEDKQQSPGALARSSSANELALRRKNNLASKILISYVLMYNVHYDISMKVHHKI